MNKRTRLLAESAMLTALSTVLLYLSGIMPTLKLALAAIAGLLPAAVVIRYGAKDGFLTYAATVLLAVLLLPGKSGTVFYAFLFGHYPMVKSYIERLRKPVLEWALKLAVFNACLLATALLFSAAFESVIPGAYVWAVFIAGSAVFALYDIGFSRLVAAYGGLIKKRF